jgi:hypothetical protein
MPRCRNAAMRASGYLDCLVECCRSDDVCRLVRIVPMEWAGLDMC